MVKERNGGRAHRVIVILLLFVILALAALSCVLALRLFPGSNPTLIGSWRMRCDVTEIVRARANAWLRAAQLGDQLDVGDGLSKLTVPVLLTLGEDGRWRRCVDTAGWEAARDEADSVLAEALRELLRLRIIDAGRPVETEAELETHIRDAVGMPSEQYLRDYGPALLPELAQLQARYDGEGSYRLEGAVIRFDGYDSARYLADGTMLALAFSEETEVYERA